MQLRHPTIIELHGVMILKVVSTELSLNPELPCLTGER